MTQLIKTCLCQVALVIVVTLFVNLTAHAQQNNVQVYKITEAGVQLDLPGGWEATKDANGAIVISKKDADSYVLYSLSVLSSDPSVTLDNLFAAFAQGIFENAKKDWQGFKTGEITKDTQGGMPVRAQKMEGTVENMGGDLEGLVIVIGSPKPLAIFGQRPKKQSDALDKEGSDVLSSIKKIQ